MCSLRGSARGLAFGVTPLENDGSFQGSGMKTVDRGAHQEVSTIKTDGDNLGEQKTRPFIGSS